MILNIEFLGGRKMKFEEAKKIGLECGLKHPPEWVNNILLHAMMIFIYEKLDKEINELVEDAKKHGVEFCPNCGYALHEDGYCYVLGGCGYKKEE